MRSLRLIFVLALFISLGFIPKENEAPVVRKVLVIPFDRFQLFSEVEIEDLNRVNNTKGDQFYNLLLSTFTEALEVNSTDKVIYRLIEDDVLNDMRLKLKYEINTKEGHYQCYLDNYEIKDYKELLQQYDCDYLLTVNWYRIIGDKKSIKLEKVKKIGYYSYHYIDYDVFTEEQTRIFSASKVRFAVEPKEENFKYMGLRITDLKPLFKKVVDGMTIEINQLGAKVK